MEGENYTENCINCGRERGPSALDVLQRKYQDEAEKLMKEKEVKAVLYKYLFAYFEEGKQELLQMVNDSNIRLYEKLYSAQEKMDALVEVNEKYRKYFLSQQFTTMKAQAQLYRERVAQEKLDIVKKKKETLKRQYEELSKTPEVQERLKRKKQFDEAKETNMKLKEEIEKLKSERRVTENKKIVKLLLAIEEKREMELELKREKANLAEIERAAEVKRAENEAKKIKTLEVPDVSAILAELGKKIEAKEAKLRELSLSPPPSPKPTLANLISKPRSKSMNAEVEPSALRNNKSCMKRKMDQPPRLTQSEPPKKVRFSDDVQYQGFSTIEQETIKKPNFSPRLPVNQMTASSSIKQQSKNSAVRKENPMFLNQPVTAKGSVKKLNQSPRELVFSPSTPISSRRAAHSPPITPKIAPDGSVAPENWMSPTQFQTLSQRSAKKPPVTPKVTSNDSVPSSQIQQPHRRTPNKRQSTTPIPEPAFKVPTTPKTKAARKQFPVEAKSAFQTPAVDPDSPRLLRSSNAFKSPNTPKLQSSPMGQSSSKGQRMQRQPNTPKVPTPMPRSSPAQVPNSKRSENFFDDSDNESNGNAAHSSGSDPFGFFTPAKKRDSPDNSKSGFFLNSSDSDDGNKENDNGFFTLNDSNNDGSEQVEDFFCSNDSPAASNNSHFF